MVAVAASPEAKAKPHGVTHRESVSLLSAGIFDRHRRETHRAGASPVLGIVDSRLGIHAHFPKPLIVDGHHRIRWSIGDHPAALEQYSPSAELSNRLSVVRNEEHGPSLLRHIFHLAEAFLLERGVTDGENFVDEKYLGLEMRRHREREPHVHAARVPLDRGVDELLHFREVDDRIELTGDL